MKLLTLIILGLFFYMNTHAQLKTGTAVPKNVTLPFNTQYPQGLHGEITKIGVIDTSEMNNGNHRGFYATAGEPAKTERKIRRVSHLPLAVKTAFKQGNYAAWYVGAIKEVNTAGKRVYIIHVDDSPVLTVPDPYLFKDDYKLSFSETGELLQKEKLP
jgi:hypothetical protein